MAEIRDRDRIDMHSMACYSRICGEDYPHSVYQGSGFALTASLSEESGVNAGCAYHAETARAQPTGLQTLHLHCGYAAYLHLCYSQHLS
jgi:hypothetical protein